MQQIIYKPVLILGSDTALFDVASDAFLRMQEYGRLYEKVLIFVPTKEVAQNVIEKGNVRIEPLFGKNKVQQFITMVSRTKQVLVEGEVGSVIAQDPFMFGLCAWLATRKTQKPFVVGIYGTDIFNKYMRTESLSRRIYTLIALFILPRATAIQTDGPETVEHLRKAYGNKVFFKPMFPANLSDLQKTERNLSTEPFKILFAGRFVAQKNIPLLLDVIKDIYAKVNTDILFTIVGKGPEYEWFKNGLVSSGCIEVCDLRGTVSREGMTKLFETHHALLMTSRYEGFPRVFMEAAVAGVPIITANVGGIQDLVVTDMTGIVFEQDTSVAEWAEQIIELSEDGEKQKMMRENIRNAFQTLYGGKTVLDYQRPVADFIESGI